MAAAEAAPDDASWDAAAVAKSWDRVVDDYKIFHNVRARGGTVDDLPASLKAAAAGQQTRRDAKTETNRPITLERQSVPGGVAASHGAPAANGIGVGASAVSSAGAGESRMGGEAPASAPGAAPPATPDINQNQPPVPGLPLPQTVLGGADETLKKLLMSWYYAGYYTGLYEGQQQAAQQQQQQQGVAEEAEDGEVDVLETPQ